MESFAKRGQGVRRCDRDTECESPRDVCKCASRVVTGEEAVFWSPSGLMVYKCKPCKPQEADL